MGAQQEVSVSKGASPPGTIVVQFTGQQHSWQYEVTPGHSSIHLLSEGEIADPVRASSADAPVPSLGPFIHCKDSPQVLSPNRTFLARCILNGERERLVVTPSNASSSILEWEGHEWRGIAAFAWSPDSEWVAVLNESEHFRKDPLGIFAALSGHPIPHSTVFLTLVNVRTHSVAEYVVRKNVLYLLYPTIVRWTE